VHLQAEEQQASHLRLMQYGIAATLEYFLHENPAALVCVDHGQSCFKKLDIDLGSSAALLLQTMGPSWKTLQA